MVIFFLQASILLAIIKADCYLHYPRGSNNRLNEQSANRNNANRLFDSQNNNRGGHNVCDCDVDDGFQATNWMATATEMYDWRFLYEQNDNAAANQLRRQYEEIFFTETWLSTTWTIQHGSGNKKLLSQIILQFGCDNFPRPTNNAGTLTTTSGGGALATAANMAWTTPSKSCGTACVRTMKRMRAHGLRFESMNGGNTGTPAAPNTFAAAPGTYNTNNANNRGRHESEEYYVFCRKRARQNGLFHATQNLNGNTQRATRQNPNNNRRGLECPEERDYYPWWNPSPWHDIAILSHDEAYCNSTVAPESQNVKEKCNCINPTWETGTTTATIFPGDNYVDHNLNATTCAANGGLWDCFKWAGSEPVCASIPWSKVNYLGNVENTNYGGKQAHYDWKLPNFAQLRDNHYCYPYRYTVDGDGTNSYNRNGATQSFDWGATDDYDTTLDCVRLVFRIRYNMSTADYDPYKTNYTHDNKPTTKGIFSPIQQNPEIDVGHLAQGMQLAINTAQTGRTFQDRTHTFLVCDRPGDASNEWGSSSKVINVGVRGKRGNIVQTFPATEYDFEPQHIEITSGDCLHFQWCGSNTHNNGNPAGDGQAGDAGEGQGGTDRSNLVEMKKMDESYPLTYDKFSDKFFDQVSCYYPLNSNSAVSTKDAQLHLGSAGFYKNVAYAKRAINKVDTDGNFAGDGEDAILNELLNNVSASYRVGLICCVQSGKSNTKKEYYFLSTRNNNFSNRAQKLKIVIAPANQLQDMSQW